MEPEVDIPGLLPVPEEDVAEVLPVADCDTDWDETEELPEMEVDTDGKPFVTVVDPTEGP